MLALNIGASSHATRCSSTASTAPTLAMARTANHTKRFNVSLQMAERTLTLRTLRHVVHLGRVNFNLSVLTNASLFFMYDVTV